MKSQYEDLAEQSDVVITSSRMNHEYFRRINLKCHVFENALDPVFLGNPTGFPLGGTDRWDGLIAVAEDPSEFVKKIDETLRNDTVDSSRRRIEAVRQETWEHRVRDMFNAVIRAVEIDPAPVSGAGRTRRSTER